MDIKKIDWTGANKELSIAASMMDTVQKELQRRYIQGWEDKIKEIFKRRTGDELTLENAGSRVCIKKYEGDENEYYYIDDKLAITVYPMEFKMPEMDEMYKLTVSRNYREHE